VPHTKKNAEKSWTRMGVRVKEVPGPQENEKLENHNNDDKYDNIGPQKKKLENQLVTKESRRATLRD